MTENKYIDWEKMQEGIYHLKIIDVYLYTEDSVMVNAELIETSELFHFKADLKEAR